MGFNVKPRVWTEDQPRTVDHVLNMTMWLSLALSINIIGTLLIILKLWGKI